MLCRPTKVAAASCQALFPVSSHCGDATSAISFPRFGDVPEQDLPKRTTIDILKSAKFMPHMLAAKYLPFLEALRLARGAVFKKVTCDQKIGSTPGAGSLATGRARWF